jgi:hypothetical protein
MAVAPVLKKVRHQGSRIEEASRMFVLPGCALRIFRPSALINQQA